MHNAYIVTGALTDERTVTLDESLPLQPTRVRLIVEPIPASASASYPGVMASIRTRQDARNFVSRMRKEVDVDLENERSSWGD